LNGTLAPAGEWWLPSAAPLARAGLCSLAQPSLRQARNTPRFVFHDACLLLIASGRLELSDGSLRQVVDTPSRLLLVQAGTCADLLKTPGGAEQCFRSVLLSLAPALLDAFQRMRPQEAAVPQGLPTPAILPLDDDLRSTLRQVLDSVPSPAVSDERLGYRLMDLLAGLAERGHGLQRTGLPATVQRLRGLMAQEPGQHWTAHRAGRALAMSEATLRRRLASEGARFEDLLVDLRMHHAMLLLQTTPWSIPHIAQACGYLSRARFSERFRARFGYPPSALRQGFRPAGPGA
jgi:AraC-like DNA-binding protein